ncbi:tungstate transport system permease protein [Carboxydocella sporoproducens DSM 16521]|uniref:Tungstate transport system permease protein n=2 Tax=Carboxydocella TaxID=178898 RepID=A0A1T4NKC1_9FIRM|nr:MULTISPECIES: ABC transporter permease [Carboxydocella]AVX20083.1 tungstate transport system permease protein [Carboxydocella thermautotrophica]AVX30500.1 tungstate transport system permease protein [Carboxydocella thermautotrophica]GAW27841.1 ABC transporter permease [Carboxydocella sp. ULO1]SJZ79720.1 tungstate transport system permease protein [Carboxydocella sporoproducens DSM 16521]
MELIWEGMVQALKLLFQGDRETWAIIALSLRVSGTATILSLVIGIPLGVYLALGDFRGRRLLVTLVNSGMGMPPVVAGLLVTILLWRNGPLGFFHLLYTPAAMIIAQTLIAAPIIVGLTMAAIQQINPKLVWQLQSLGASPLHIIGILLKEARYSLLAAVMAGFGAVVSEVGASMMVGGNIQGETRVLTTATVMEVSKGNFGLAMALSFVLLFLSYGVTYLLTLLQQRRG